MDVLEREEKPVVLTYKDANIETLFEPKEILDWLNDPELKIDRDKCIDKIKGPI